MKNHENFENVIELFPDSNNKPVDFETEFNEMKARNEVYRRKIEMQAIAEGREKFDADKLMTMYYPNETSDDVEKIKSRVEELKNDYYLSNAKTLQEFAKIREKYDVYKDSTGHDD